jgi:membrane associated rhomboid family serine protease
MSYPSYGTSEEHQPVTWWRGHPLYASHLIVIGFAASMLVTTGFLLARWGGVLELLAFSSAEVLRGEVWRILTYGLVNAPSIPFAIDLLMIVWFGREVERFLGRRVFLQLYAGIYLIKPLLFTALGAWRATSFSGEVGAFALFIAFATLFPNAPLLFNILAKWAALALVGILALSALAARQWEQLLELLATCGFAFGFVRLQQGHFSLPRVRLVRRKTNLRVLPDERPKPEAVPVAAPRGDPMAEVDALLDKIAKSGIHSLTKAERAKLDAARADLLKRDGKRP